MVGSLSGVTISGLTSFGNTQRSLILNNSVSGNSYFKTINLQAGTGEVCPQGIYFGGAINNLTIANYSIGTVTAHSTADITIGAIATCKINFVNGTLGSSTKIQGNSFLDKLSFISTHRYGGVAGADFSYGAYGTVSSDSTIFDSSPRSLRLTPSNATYSQFVPIGRVNLPSGQSATLSVKVRKSNTGAGDAATYNGSQQPRIIMRANASAGSSFDADQIVATATNAANGAWETLTFTTPTSSDNTAVEFMLEANGTTGWVNLDTWTVT